MNSRAFRASTSKSGDAVDAPMTPDISERAFEEGDRVRVAARRAGRLPGRRVGGSGVGTGIRGRAAAGRLPQAPAGGLRPRALPDPDRRRRLPAGHPAQGVGEAQAAPRGRREAALPRPALPRDCPPRGPRRAAQRRQGLGLQVPAGVLPPGERPQRGTAAAARRQPLRGCASAPLQRAGRAEPRPRALPERRPHLHGRAQEPSQRAGRPGRHPAVPGGP